MGGGVELFVDNYPLLPKTSFLGNFPHIGRKQLLEKKYTFDAYSRLR